MPIRKAHPSDKPILAALCTAAFFDEDLFGRVMHPRRHEFPDDVVIYWRGHVRNHWFDVSNRFVVAVIDDEERQEGDDGKGKGGKKGKEKIVGMAIWQRQGDGGRKWGYGLGFGGWVYRKILAPLLPIYDILTTPFRPRNRALSPTNSNILALSYPYSAHHWTHPQRRENWYLSLLAVDPEYQGRGFGRELVAWGVQEAEKEGICASVMRSAGNEEFYRRCGFGVRVGNGCEGLGNPLLREGVKGGEILFMVPSGLEGGFDGAVKEVAGAGVGARANQ